MSIELKLRGDREQSICSCTTAYFLVCNVSTGEQGMLFKATQIDTGTREAEGRAQCTSTLTVMTQQSTSEMGGCCP